MLKNRITSVPEQEIPLPEKVEGYLDISLRVSSPDMIWRVVIL